MPASHRSHRAPATPRAPRPAAARRGPGRPPAGPDAQAAIRHRLLQAIRTVFSQVGYHGLSVERVLAEAGLSRPTFYKHFRNTDEAIDTVLREVNDRLIEALRTAVAGSANPFLALDAGLCAWRDWGGQLGALLCPLFAELHDKQSPASRHRRRALDILGQDLEAMIARFGRPIPARIQLDALLNGVEYLGYRFHLETAGDDASWQQTRDTMLRLAIGLLGSANELAHAPQLAAALGIHLDPPSVARRKTRPRPTP